MSTVEYKLKSSPSTTAPFDWETDAFYTSAVVLGIDIGIEGIGIWLRKGRGHVYARTFLFNTPEAAPLKGRRLLRGGRRCRQSEKHREVLLKQFCVEFDLPWTEIKDEENEDGPFKLRLRAVRSKLASKEALVVCLRHIIKHRGYDYHETDGGSFPWGDELKADVATAWAKAAYCSPEDAAEFLHDVSDCGWNEKQLASFRNALQAAIERHKQGIEAALEIHFAQGKNNLRVPARKHNFPRSLVWKHMETICGNHLAFFSGKAEMTAVLHKLKLILNYHRKKPGALAERKVNRCPIAKHLFDGVIPKCDSNSNPHIRRFKLLEFLATRSFVSKDGTRLLANAGLMKWLLDEVLAKDIQVVEANNAKGGQKQERRKFGGFREEFIRAFDPKEEIELASDRVSHNKDFFEQLGDLLRPKLSVLNARASLCGKSAEELFKRAAKNGYNAMMIREILTEPLFSGQSFYTLRQAAAAGFGIYPQVEFLLGRRSKKRKQAVPGILRQIFELPEVSSNLAGQKIPDYVIIETIGDMPRNLDQAKEIQDEQKRRRKFKDELFEKFGVHDQQQDSEARKRVLLYDQQGGSRCEAICPYTGDSLGNDPLSPKLQIDHIFPESRGGISEMVNLVLTHEITNNQRKGNLTPYEAFGGKQKTAEWRELCARVQKMGWNKQKRELVLREESSCPEWDNMTRMAQLARQLREEAARWLGVFGDDAKVRQKIGTPTGYQTSVCRESWNENLPADFYPKKNRNNLRHHLWDAAVISHIPPGKGMNLTNCAGIFFHAGKSKHGNITHARVARTWPGFKIFREGHRRPVSCRKNQTNRSKKSRFQQWIYGFPDKNGQMWARDSLKSLADKSNLLELLRDAGIDENQLPAPSF
jgi:5-methylcytosine-specific restriction endonuclease McrA